MGIQSLEGGRHGVWGGRTWPSRGPQRPSLSPTSVGKSQQSRPQVRSERPVPQARKPSACQNQARAAVRALGSPLTSLGRLPLRAHTPAPRTPRAGQPGLQHWSEERTPALPSIVGPPRSPQAS